jgi:D-serine deaminase-like pyridoxal phosphate-dependent protein
VATQGARVTVVASGGMPVVHKADLAKGGMPMTVVTAGGAPVTIVSAGGQPVTLLNEDGTLYVP